jgi:hypothetical protein
MTPVFDYADSTSYVSCISAGARAFGDSVSCSLYVRQNGENATAPSSDFAILFNNIAVTPLLTTKDFGFSYSFLVPSPSSFVDNFVVSISIDSLYTIQTSYRVFGTFAGVPNSNSSLICNNSVVRYNTILACTVTFFAAPQVQTSVIQSDLSVISILDSFLGPITPDINAVVSHDGGISYNFLMNLHAVVGPHCRITVSVADSPVTSLTFPVYGIPTMSSAISCIAQNSTYGTIHFLEQVNCTISVMDAFGITSAVPTDFQVALNNDLASVSLSSVDFGQHFNFQVFSPNSSAFTFNISVVLASTGFEIAFSPVKLQVICM